MILIDANILIALVDESDQLHRRARQDGQSLGNAAIYLTTPVLAETCFYLASPYKRERLFAMLDQLQIRLYPREHELSLREIQAWLIKYAEHEPDFADAQLVQLSRLNRKLKIWTYDKEFRTVWRRLDGSAVPMVVKAHG